MNIRLHFILIFALAFGLIACGEKERHKAQQIYQVKPERLQHNLYFTGTIQPLRETSITSPVGGQVQAIHVHYGQWVKKGQLLITINSSELQKQYNDTLTEYLKAKDTYAISQAKFSGTLDLWKSGLIAKNNYLSEKSSLATARVALMQVTRKLNEVTKKIDDGNGNHLTQLSLADFEKVRQALTSNHNLIQIKASADGVLLYPPKSSEDNTSKLTVGSAIKAGQVMGLIGDLSGVRVEIDIPEIDIDKIKPGISAEITGVALGSQVLQGKLVAVNAQATTTNNNTLPSFSAAVEVKALNETQRAVIRVGMSASIALHLDTGSQLLIPIAALKQEKGNTVVQLKNADGSTKTQVITTGPAQTDKVVVLLG